MAAAGGDAPPPRGRSSHSCDVIGGHVYVFGGENAPRVPVDNALYRYDLNKESWTTLKTEGEALEEAFRGPEDPM